MVEIVVCMEAMRRVFKKIFENFTYCKNDKIRSIYRNCSKYSWKILKNEIGIRSRSYVVTNWSHFELLREKVIIIALGVFVRFL